ncbi:lipopolysaccharide biosynthesis protein [Microbacterium plantarum]|uniref:lipopolysaccharide biosynthesis protein n=1 Tax=Microbacterium plantarum TaxID=1816425 RepID=UPI002B485D6D|nr:lipopolysaccharide biosynthesis protein [Microbacterium plantarum]WRK16916.1 lipopolysaccharide biosynthesis protein [Microbacterium plantarum]
MRARFAVSIGGRIGSALLQAGIFALLARALGLDGFGVFSLALAMSGFSLSLLDLGMGNRVLRGLRDNREKGALATYSILRAVLAAVLPVTAAIVAGSLEEPVWIAACAAAYAIGESTGDVAVGIRQGRKSSVTAMTILLVRRAATIAPLVLSNSEQAAATAMLIAAVVGITSYAAVAAANLARPVSLNRLMRENLSLIASGGATNLSQLDTAIVASSLGTAGAGYYGAGMRLFNPINLGINTLLQVLIPELASAPSQSQRKQHFLRARKLVLLASIVTVGASAFAPALVTFLYGPEFSGAAPIAIAVFVSAAISGLAQLHMSWFYAIGVPRIVPIGMWASVALGLSLIWLLSQNAGISGAAIGFVAMHLLLAVSIIAPCEVAIRKIDG